MKKTLLLLLILSSLQWAMAHNLRNEKVLQRSWTIAGIGEPVSGSFLLMKSNEVFIETGEGHTVHYPLERFGPADRTFISRRQAIIDAINFPPANMNSPSMVKGSPYLIRAALAIGVVSVLVAAWFVYKTGAKRRLTMPIIITALITLLVGFRRGEFRLMQVNSDPASIDSAFVPFRPLINTFWDNTYFHVESQGIPNTHEMMVGISDHGWQQQVPIPQCYLGNNSWSIPLQPSIAPSPVPVSPAHFTRGAIAVAVNGVPIFNPYTNTGVDAYLDGQLDNYGGHCGRADDYHYHIAPLHLYAYTSPTLPIAYALDGFAVYGAVEPDGSAMAALDTNHGHYGSNGVYHYHGESVAPYMIGNMVGMVTEDSTAQIVPQAAARPVRPWLTPLRGALITDCTPNASGNGYSLTYTLAGNTDSIVYSWTPSGVYTFNFYTVNGLNTQVYNGFTPCSLSAGVLATPAEDYEFLVYPNPAHQAVSILPKGEWTERMVHELQVLSLDGKILNKWNGYRKQLDVSGYAPGIYLLHVTTESGSSVQKFMVQ